MKLHDYWPPSKMLGEAKPLEEKPLYSMGNVRKGMRLKLMMVGKEVGVDV